MKKRKDRKCVIKAHNLYISGVGYNISFVEDLQNARVYASHSAAKNSMGHYRIYRTIYMYYIRIVKTAKYVNNSISFSNICKKFIA